MNATPNRQLGRGWKNKYVLKVLHKSISDSNPLSVTTSQSVLLMSFC